VLAQTQLSSGDSSGGLFTCKFTFSFMITEGEGDYVVSVSHRGQQHFTFDQLDTDGVHLTLGS
jgi:hypothetical protein